jgi:hypothetical protein
MNAGMVRTPERLPLLVQTVWTSSFEMIHRRAQPHIILMG